MAMQIEINSGNLCKYDPKIVSNIFRNIEIRNNEAIKEIQQEKKEFEEKTEKVIQFIQFRNKVDKLEAGYYLMVSSNERNVVKKMSVKSKEEIWNTALKRTSGNKKKAISLIFSSDNI